MSATVEAEPSPSSQTVSSSHDLQVPQQRKVSLLFPQTIHLSQHIKKQGEGEEDRDVGVVVPGVEGKSFSGSVFVSVVGDEQGPLFQDAKANKQDAHLCLTTVVTNTKAVSLRMKTG